MNPRKRIASVLMAMSMLFPILPISPVSAATLNVTAYGANGGDTSDDKQGITNAIAAAASGDTVYFPSGTYYITGTIAAKSGIKLIGQNKDTTIIKYSGTTDNNMITLSNTTGVEVAQLTLDGNNNTHVVSGIWGEPGGNHNIHHNVIKDLIKSDGFAPFGVILSATNNSIIADNTFTNIGVNSTWGGAIRAGWNSNNTQILRNTITNTGRGGIFANDNCSGVVVKGNTVMGSGLHEHGLAIELHTNCNNSVIEDNTTDHWISAVRSSYVAVRRNTVHTTDGTVQGMGLEVMVDHGVTTDNLVDGGQQVGMQQSPGTGYQYWGYNTIQNMVMWGMQLQGEGTGEIEQFQYFYKNIFRNGAAGHPAAAYPGYDGNAVRIHGNSQNLTFDSNQIINNGRKGIEITNAAGVDRLSFINNIITGNGGASIDQYPASASHLEWSNNTVSGNGTNTQLTSRGFSNPKPVANFSAPLSVQLGQPITFTNSSTDNGSIAEHLWDLGEGPPLNSVSPTYTYQKAGTYRVTLVVWDNEGRASLKEQTVNVYAGPPDTQAPTAPALTSPSKSNVTVDLAWSGSTDNVGVVGYDIYKNGTLAGSTSGAGATTFTATGLTPSTAYSFTVKAKDAASNVSVASNTLNVTTAAGDTQAPTTPTNLALTGKTDTSVSLSWSASSDNVGVTGYNVYYGTTLAGSTTGPSATNFTASGLAPNTAYTFTVKAKDASNNVSAASNAVSVTTEPLANWVLCAGENNTCSFSGTKQVRFGANGSYFYGTYTNSVMCSTNQFGDPAPGAYKSCEVNLAGTGGGGDSQAPTAPSGLTAPAKTDTSVNLSWTASTDNVGVTGYDVYRGSTLAGSTTSATTFQVTGLTANTAYTFTVKAKDAAGNVSAASNILSVTTNAGTGANWVYCTGENGTCTFTGTKEVRYGANGSYNYGTFTNSVNCSNSTFGDPISGTAKSCDVNMGGSGGGDTQAPTAPTGLISPSKTSTSVSLSWTASTDNTGVTGYDVYNGSTLAGSAPGTTFTVSGLTANTAYTFTVKAKDAANNVSSASNALNVTTNASGGGTGSVTREYWTGIAGTSVSSIPTGTTPSGTSTLTTLEGPTNWADNYGARIRGYITPTTTGSYTFYISGDDENQLFLSTNNSPSNKSMIANVYEYTGVREWNKHSSQQSAAVTLTAGQSYYFEVLHKEGAGGDNLAVGWTGPGISTITVIGSSNLSAY
ncbi:fibronectin type III domain-containing protein [Paenibacillus swuensis]|uniref:fibronectin type III domain-containing protein n=1 Tax=Paenibacillus swuensis TaxID=1178515 RepID=UPI001E4FA58E|nr:fibronectin type III domain-containing protein [Paenibacillus swuensis]